MIPKKFKQHKAAAIAAISALSFTAVVGALSFYSQNIAEHQVKAALNTNSQSQEPTAYAPWSEDTLYQKVVTDQDIARQVCNKYKLNYESVTMKDITRDMRNYEEALELIKDYGTLPLLSDNIEGIDSLETYLCEIYAFDGGKSIIEKYCQTNNIDTQGTKIKDLTTDDLIIIGETAYNTSDHPKN